MRFHHVHDAERYILRYKLELLEESNTRKIESKALKEKADASQARSTVQKAILLKSVCGRVCVSARGGSLIIGITVYYYKKLLREVVLVAPNWSALSCEVASMEIW